MIRNIQTNQNLKSLLPSQPVHAPQAVAGKRTDQVSISNPSQLQSLEAMEKFVMDKLAEAFPVSKAEEAAPEESALYPSGASARQVAGTIFKGVTESIFEAYQRSHPDMTEAGFEEFIAKVREGIGEGVGQAREMLQSTDSMSEEMDGAIEETLSVLHGRLDDWFAEMSSKLFGSDS